MSEREGWVRAIDVDPVAKLDFLHEHVGLGAEWQASERRAEIAAMQEPLAARLADAEARASRVAEIFAHIEDDPRYDDSFGAAGLFNLRDDLREALRGDQ